MADYGWNPFQERVDCHITGEVIKTAADTRKEFVPRNAPFFGSRNFVLRRQGVTTPLVLGVDYVFGHPFGRFISKYNRNVFGSIIMLKQINAILVAEYDTIGGPFVLDAVAFATLVANIANSPRTADWANLVNVPTEFPADPHEHPAAQTYDWLECMGYMRSMVLAITETSSDELSVKEMLQEHMSKPLDEAHVADKGMMGLDLVDNMRKATVADLSGNSANVAVTIEVLKEAFRRAGLGTLKLD